MPVSFVFAYACPSGTVCKSAKLPLDVIQIDLKVISNAISKAYNIIVSFVRHRYLMAEQSKGGGNKSTSIRKNNFTG